MAIHQGNSVLRGGPELARAHAAVVLLHGRGATAEDIMALGEAVASPAARVALLAPRAAGGAWYPQRFFAPLEQNEPYLTSALEAVAEVCASIEKAGVPWERIVLLGFSQGACLALEYAARNPRRYG